MISNLIGHVLDTHLVRLAARHGCQSTRYADDLTFSTNEPSFPESIAKCVSGKKHEWVPGDDLVKIVKSSGFRINSSKTRMQYHDSRQEVTGLIVNRKVNVKSEYRRLVRVMTHRLLRTGQFEYSHTIAGKKTVIPGKPQELHGMLGFVDHLDLHNWERELRTVDLDPGTTRADRAKLSHTEREFLATQDAKLSSKERVYRRFLLFSQFYAAQKPVILCEGSTDSVYLVHAIRSLVGHLPTLATQSPKGEVSLNVRLYRYHKRQPKKPVVGHAREINSTGRILELHGGSGELLKFAKVYRSHLEEIKAPGAYEPIILVVDNDDGANGIFGYARSFHANVPRFLNESVWVTQHCKGLSLLVTIAMQEAMGDSRLPWTWLESGLAFRRSTAQTPDAKELLALLVQLEDEGLAESSDSGCLSSLILASARKSRFTGLIRTPFVRKLAAIRPFQFFLSFWFVPLRLRPPHVDAFLRSQPSWQAAAFRVGRVSPQPVGAFAGFPLPPPLQPDPLASHASRRAMRLLTSSSSKTASVSRTPSTRCTRLVVL